MVFDATSLAATTNSSVKNVQFKPAAANLDRKMLIIGSYDNAKTGIADNIPALILSSADAGATYGFGSMIHRLALKGALGTQGLATYIVPQPEAGGAAAALGELDFTVTGAIAGTIYLYIAGDLVSFNIATGDTKEEIADLCVAAINADVNLPVTAVKVAVTFEVTITAKTLGTYGNEVSLDYNLGAGQVAPTGVALLVSTAMAGGTGTPVIQNALDGLGTGDSANEDYFTDVVHGYLQDSTTLDAIETYVGSGNTFTGLYSKTVGRPFRVLTGDTADGSAGLTALIVITDGRLLDRANGIISAPGSASHPSEIAAQAMGHMARINQNIVAEHYVNVALTGVWPGANADNWTKDYANRDLAVKSGLSTTQIKNGVVTMQDMQTMYRPANVLVENNGYRSMVNIAKLQNIMENIKLNFSQEKWQGVFIVADKTRVGAANAGKARDIQDVINDDLALAESFAELGWIFTDSFTKSELAKRDGNGDYISVVIRTGGTGFDNNFKVILSGVGGILDSVTEFDISLAALN